MKEKTRGGGLLALAWGGGREKRKIGRERVGERDVPSGEMISARKISGGGGTVFKTSTYSPGDCSSKGGIMIDHLNICRAKFDSGN